MGIEIVSTRPVFDFRNERGADGKPLRHGLFMHARDYRVGDRVNTWTYASRNENPSGLVANAVVVVGKVGDRVLIADEFRVPLGCREYGFSAGLMEPGEIPEDAAIREFREEVGLWATHVYPRLTTPLLVSSAGLSDEAVQIVFLEAEGEVNHKLCEPSEDIHAELMDFEQVMQIFHRKDLAVSAKAWGVMWGWSLAGYLAFGPAGYPEERVPVQWTDKGTPSESFAF